MSLYSLAEQKAHRPDLGLLALRVVFGLFIFLSGVDKLMGGGAMFQEIGSSMAMFGVTWEPKFWGLLCALTETFGGLFIILGIFFRPAALLLVLNMVVASVAMVKMSGAPDHSSMDAFMRWLGNVATPVYFLAVFLALLFLGAGKYAIQKKGGGSRASAGASRE